MKKIVVCLLTCCMLLCGNVFAMEDNTTLTGIINEVYITDGMGDKVQCLVLTLDEEKAFDVYDDMGDMVHVKTNEIQLSSKDYKPDMNGKRVTVKGNDLFQGLTYYYIRPVMMLNAKITMEEMEQSNYPDYVEAYADFIQKALTVKDENSNGDNRISALQLIDIDFNSVPELIIFDGGAGGSIGVNIVSVVNGVAKIIYGSSYFSNEAFEKDAAVAYTDKNGQIGKRFSNAVETLSDVFEMRRMDATGELFWYLKSTDDSGEKILYSAYKCEKNNLLFSNIATSAFEADYESDPKAVWSMFFMHTTPEQGYQIMLSTRNEDYTLSSEWETIKNNRGKLKEWLSSYVVQDIYDGRQATVLVNETKVKTDNLTIIRDGRTLVPLRTISEALGATVNWNNETQTVTIKRNETAVLMSIGQNIFYKNNEPISLDVAPIIKNDRTLVPIRAIAEAFNCVVVWDDYYIFISDTK